MNSEKREFKSLTEDEFQQILLNNRDLSLSGRRDHYVQQALLNNFKSGVSRGKNLIFVSNDRRVAKEVTIESIAFRNDNENEKLAHIIKDVDDNFPKLIKSINSQKVFSRAELELCTNYIVTSLIRSPFFHSFMCSQLIDISKKLKVEFPDKPEIEANKREIAKLKSIFWDVCQKNIIPFINSSFDVRFQYTSEELVFIIGDNPVIPCPKSSGKRRMDFGFAYTNFYLPVKPELVLIFGKKDRLDKQKIFTNREINKRFLKN